MCLLLAIIWTEGSALASEQRVALLQSEMIDKPPLHDFSLLPRTVSPISQMAGHVLGNINRIRNLHGRVLGPQIVRNGDKRFWYEAIAKLMEYG